MRVCEWGEGGGSDAGSMEIFLTFMKVPTADTYPLCLGHKIYIIICKTNIMHNRHAIITIIVTCNKHNY